MIKILFICHGNICRSTMAEFVLKDMVKKLNKENFFEIKSSATSREEIGNDIHAGTKKKLRDVGIPFSKRSAVQFKKSDYLYYDYIICMDSNNVRNLLSIIGNDNDNKVFRLLDFTEYKKDIADPWYTGNFDKTYEDIFNGCSAFLEKINIK